MNVICFPGRMIGANSYLIRDEGGCAVVIDPWNADAIASQVRDERLTLSAILLTHGHFDHTYGQAKLKSEFSVPTYLHTADAEMIDDHTKNGTKLAGMLFKGHSFGQADVLLSGGESLTFGDLTFRVLHTPGHTKGSVCYLCGDVLFSGDTLFRGSVGRTDLYGGDPDALKRSLGVLSSLDGVKTVYPGHGDPTTMEDERIRNPYLR